MSAFWPMHRTARLATIRTLLDVPAPDVDVSPINYPARYKVTLKREHVAYGINDPDLDTGWPEHA